MPLPTPTDDASAAFVAELLRHQRRIYLFIASLLASPTDIEDVYQQTCLALWKKRGQLPEVRDFFAWACGFARNEALHQIRSNSRSRHLYLPDDLLAALLRDPAVRVSYRRIVWLHANLMRIWCQDIGGMPWMPQPASDEPAAKHDARARERPRRTGL